MLSILASIVIPQATAAELFPLVPGSKWSYEITGSGSGKYDQEVGFPVEIDGKSLAPILVKVGTKITQTTFYDVAPSGVYILGHDAKKLWEKPLPVFQIGEKGAQWAFDGPSPYENDTAARMALTGQSKWIGERAYLGEKRRCLEVKTETKIGISASTATRFVQKTVYAVGIGMVEMDEEVTLGKTTNKRKVKIVKFERPERGV